MLRITYTPPNEPPRTFEIEELEDDLSALEAELIEEAGGQQWGSYLEWSTQMIAGSMRACRVLLWVLLRRENPNLQLDTLNYPLSALQFDVDAEEDLNVTPPAEPEGKDEPVASDISSL
jgi:hypothetical protein